MKQNGVLWVIAGLLALILVAGVGGAVVIVGNQRAQAVRDAEARKASEMQAAARDQQAAWDALDMKQIELLNRLAAQ